MSLKKFIPFGCAVATVALELVALSYFGVIDRLGPQPALIKTAEVSRAPSAQAWLLRTDELAAIIWGDHGADFKCGALCGIFAEPNDQKPAMYPSPALHDPKKKLLI